jgi:hypothetical protein
LKEIRKDFPEQTSFIMASFKRDFEDPENKDMLNRTMFMAIGFDTYQATIIAAAFLGLPQFINLSVADDGYHKYISPFLLPVVY